MGACSVQGYGEKAPGIGAFVYPGSGATCDTRPASAGTTAMATTSAAQPYDLPTAEEVSPGFAPPWMILALPERLVCMYSACHQLTNFCMFTIKVNTVAVTTFMFIIIS